MTLTNGKILLLIYLNYQYYRALRKYSDLKYQPQDKFTLNQFVEEIVAFLTVLKSDRFEVLKNIVILTEYGTPHFLPDRCFFISTNQTVSF